MRVAEWFDHISMAAVVTQTSPIVQEIAKAAIIGALSAGIVLYVSDAKQENELRHISNSLQEIKARLQRMEADIYRPRWSADPECKQ